MAASPVVPMNTTYTSIIPAPLDWLSLIKTVAIVLVFIVSTLALLFGNLNSVEQQYALQLAVATGATLGVLRITDVVANVLNVRAFLGNQAAQKAGVFPQASNTSLVSAPKNEAGTS